MKQANIVGNKIKEYRNLKNVGQSELSKLLEEKGVYVCRGSISRIEQHERTVSDFELKAFAEVFGVSVCDLFEAEQ